MSQKINGTHCGTWGGDFGRGGGVLVLFWVMSKGDRSDHVKIEVAKKGV